MKYTIEHIPVLESLSGNSLEIQVHRFQGSKPGPNVYLQSSVHAAEYQGNPVIYFLMRRLEELGDFAGSITLVPFCNPYGSMLRIGEFTYGRFDPLTGENWNRQYWNSVCVNESARSDEHQINLEVFLSERKACHFSEVQAQFQQSLVKATEQRLRHEKISGATYARTLALQLQSLAATADLVLDLHCDSVSLPHAFTPDYLLEQARALPVNYLVRFSEEFTGALDEAIAIPCWKLRNQAKDSSLFSEEQMISVNPVAAYTVELGNMETIDLNLAQIQAEGLLQFLGISKRSEDSQQSQKFSVPAEDFVRIYAERGGLVDFQAMLGQHVERGQKIAEILNLSTAKLGSLENCLVPVNAPDSGIILTRSGSAATHQHGVIAKMFRNPRQE